MDVHLRECQIGMPVPVGRGLPAIPGDRFGCNCGIPGLMLAECEVAAIRQEIYAGRHAFLLAEITDPILRSLVTAHGPGSDELFPDCDECADAVFWPCQVWMFVSDRM